MVQHGGHYRKRTLDFSDKHRNVIWTELYFDSTIFKFPSKLHSWPNSPPMWSTSWRSSTRSSSIGRCIDGIMPAILGRLRPTWSCWYRSSIELKQVAAVISYFGSCFAVELCSKTATSWDGITSGSIILPDWCIRTLWRFVPDCHDYRFERIDIWKLYFILQLQSGHGKLEHFRRRLQEYLNYGTEYSAVLLVNLQKLLSNVSHTIQVDNAKKDDGCTKPDYQIFRWRDFTPKIERFHTKIKDCWKTVNNKICV